MKTKRFIGFCVLIGLLTVTVLSCSDEYVTSKSNNGSMGSLSFSWSQSYSGDTLVLSCQQMLQYQNGGKTTTLTPVATLKLFCQSALIEYDKSTGVEPVYLKSDSSGGYTGTSPRYRNITQKFYFNDGQIVVAVLNYPIYSYYDSGRELFYPYVEFKELMFTNVTLETKNNLICPIISFSMPWSTNTNDDSGKKEVSISYAKNEVDVKDKLLKTSFTQGYEWLSNNSFALYVEKTEHWQIAGEQKSKNYSPALSFVLTASENRSLEVSDFDFSGTLYANETSKQKIPDETTWSIKKGYSQPRVDFTNGVETFSDTFSYPLYEANVTWEGQRFDFDLSVEFKETYQVTYFTTDKGQNVTNAKVKFCGKSFEKQVVTSFSKKSATEPDPTSKYGKVLGFKVTAVFEPANLENESGNITKKCVLIRYEKGYEWGISDFYADFPENYTFTETSYTGFDSAAKKSTSASFQLARTVQSNTSIIWYDENNRHISGIDALTCKIYGWSNIVDKIYASEVPGYTATYGDNSYTITIKAPSGQTKTFSSY